MEESYFDFKKYWLLIKHWAWLLILGLVLGATIGLVISLFATPIYQATTSVMITRGNITDQSLDIYSSYYSDELTQTYLQLLKTETVIDKTSERLGVDLEKVKIETQAVQDTTIIEIKVDHPSPQIAISIADTLVDVLTEQNETIQSGRYIQMEESLTAQKNQLESQIASLQAQINQASIKTVEEQEKWIQDQIASLKDEQDTLPKEISALRGATTPEGRNEYEQKKARLDQVELLLPLYEQSYTDLVVYGKQVDAAKSSTNSQLTLLTTTQSLYQQIYVSVLDSLESVRLAGMQNTPSIVQIDAASTGEDPVRPRPLLNTAMAGLIGLLLTTSIVVMKEYLDNSIKTSDDLENLLGLNAIGYISDINKNEMEEIGGVFVEKQPRSPISESFRSLRTNVEFSSVDKPIKTLLITSPEPGTGKTTVAVNLAIIFAQKGRRVLLLDADLRRPFIHRLVGLQNRIGLTDLLLESQGVKDVSHKYKGTENLTVITSGSLPPNPAELLGSNRMETVFKEFNQSFDLIVIDSPPSIVADAQVLAAKVDAVLLVVQPGKTQRDASLATIDLLNRANARIIGVVLNRITKNGGKYYSQYQYQNYEYKQTAEKKKVLRKRTADADNQENY